MTFRRAFVLVLGQSVDIPSFGHYRYAFSKTSQLNISDLQAVQNTTVANILKQVKKDIGYDAIQINEFVVNFKKTVGDVLKLYFYGN